MADSRTAPVVRRTWYYSGNVQGVGFRYTATSLAGRFPVLGFVRNLGDGRVELVAEGEVGALERFERALAEAMSGCIEHQECHESAATGEFESFTIRG